MTPVEPSPLDLNAEADLIPVRGDIETYRRHAVALERRALDRIDEICGRPARTP